MMTMRQWAALGVVMGGLCSLSAPATAAEITRRINPDNGCTYSLLGTASGGGYEGIGWAAAESEAIALGGHLATINNAAENAWIQMSLFSPDQPWRSRLIGLTDEGHEGTWSWVSGQSVSYLNFWPWEGTGGIGENVVAMSGRPDGYWFDLPATDTGCLAVVEMAGSVIRHNWINAAGGLYATATNWSPLGPVGSGEAAHFSLANTYAVDFAAGTTIAAMAVVEAGTVTFNLPARTYQLAELYVATTGRARLTVAGTSGQVTAQYVTLGQDAGSSGTLVVQQAAVAGFNQAFVGRTGYGKVDLSAGARFSGTSLYVAYDAGSQGEVVVSGAGSQISVTGPLTLGIGGAGSLTVQSGGRVSGSTLSVGEQGGSQGALLLSGASGASFTSDAWIGVNGIGSLRVEGSSTLSGSAGRVGLWTGGRGEVTITGTGSRWDLTGDLVVGNDGTGRLDVLSGATVTANGITLGQSAWGQGVLRVAGGTLVLPGAWLTIGNDGVGEATFTAGSVINVSGGGLAVANQWTASGSGQIDGSSVMTLGEDLAVGRGGGGSFGVVGSATVACRNAVIGGGGGVGDLLVSGTRARLLGEGLFAGVDAGSSGSVRIDGGGQFVGTSWSAIGRDTDSQGQVVVEGAGSLFHTGALTVGGGGMGRLDVRGGAQLVLEYGEFLVGESSSSSGMVFASGPGTLMGSTVVPLILGSEGSGVMQIESGAIVSSDYVHLARSSTGSLGVLLVAGSGSRLESGSDIWIGENGRGTVEVADGGRVRSVWTTELGVSAPEAWGDLVVRGTGSVYEVTNGGLVSWRGSLTVRDGGLLACGPNEILVFNNSVVNLWGGTIISSDRLRFESGSGDLQGFGTVACAVQGDFGAIRAQGGVLRLGTTGRTDGIAVNADVYVESGATLELLDADALALPRTVQLTNGVLIGRNGLELWNDAAGYGVIVGRSTRGIPSPSGRVDLGCSLDVGASLARVYSNDLADLGPLTTLSGGSLFAPRGLRLQDGDVLRGDGSLNANVTLENGILQSGTGTLAVRGALSGHGVVIGNVTAWSWPIASTSDTVNLGVALSVGSQTATIYSAGRASLSWATLSGGRIVAPAGIRLPDGGGISGTGTVEGSVLLENAILDGSLAVTGGIGGSGILFGAVTGSITDGAQPFRMTWPTLISGQSARVVGAGMVLSNTLWLASATITSSALTFQNGDFGSQIVGSGTVDSEIWLSGQGVITPSGSGLTFTRAIHCASPASIGGTSIRLLAGASLEGACSVLADIRSDPGSTITVASWMTLGRAGAAGSLDLRGTLAINGSGVLQSADKAKLSGETILTDGVLTAVNGIEVATSALVSGRGRIVVGGDASHGLDVRGRVAFSGPSEIRGDVTIFSAAKLQANGGGPVTFWDDVINNGQIEAGVNTTLVYYGSVSGSGSFIGSGTSYFAGDLHPGSSPAAVSFGGNVVFGPGAGLQIEVRGTVLGGEYDTLTIAGSVQLAGDMEIALLPGARFPAGRTFNVVAAAGRIGTFDSVSVPLTTGGDPYFAVTYTASGLQLLSLVGVSIPGDANCDGIVDQADYTVWYNHYGAGGATWDVGDFNGDKLVDQADYTIWYNHYGSTGGSVPEPMTMALLAIGGLAVLRRRNA